MPEQKEQKVNVKQAAGILEVSERTIQRWVKRDFIKAEKIGPKPNISIKLSEIRKIKPTI